MLASLLLALSAQAEPAPSPAPDVEVAPVVAPAAEPPTPVDETPPAEAGVAPAVVESPPAVASPLDDAQAHLARGEATEAVGEVLAHVRNGDLGAETGPRARALLMEAAAVLAGAGELKGAAVAADAAAALATPDDTATRRAAAAHLAAYADALADDDEPAARGLAERARGLDSDNVLAKDLVIELAGTDTWQTGHLTLLGGVGVTAVAGGAFIAGQGIERDARSRVHSRAELDVMLAQRLGAGIVAWTASVVGAVGVGAGLALIMMHDPGPDPEIPLPFEGATRSTP